MANAIAGFRACGIFPLNVNCIPDHFFTISDQIKPITSVQTPQSPPSQSPSKPSGSGLPAKLVETTSPSKILAKEHPFPLLPTPKSKHKQAATVLTSPDNLKYKKTSNPILIKGQAKKRKVTEVVEDDNNACIECLENYFETKRKLIALDVVHVKNGSTSLVLYMLHIALIVEDKISKIQI